MGSLYYKTLGLDEPGTAVPVHGGTAGPFNNFQPYLYWTTVRSRPLVIGARSVAESIVCEVGRSDIRRSASRAPCTGASITRQDIPQRQVSSRRWHHLRRRLAIDSEEHTSPSQQPVSRSFRELAL
jgi:hypothetical protein